MANIIIKKRMQGFEGNIQAGESSRSDAKNYAGSLALGTGFADDRGQFLIAGEYSHQKGIKQSDRGWANGQCGYVPQTVGGTAYSNVPACGLNLSGLTNGGVIVGISAVRTNGGIIAGNALSALPASNPLYGKQFINSSSSSPYNYGTLLGSTYAQGGDGTWLGNGITLTPTNERKSLFARGTFEFTSNLRAFAEASYASSTASADLFPNAIPASSDTTIVIKNDNPFIPADIKAILAANPSITACGLGRATPEWGSWHSDNKTTTKRFAAVLDGSFGETGSWKSYVTSGQSQFNIRGSNNPIEANLRAALDVVQGPNGPICRINSTVASDVAITSQASYAGYGASACCIAANPFGLGSLANVKNYILGQVTNFQTYKQNAAGLSAQYEPFSVWAGPAQGNTQSGG